MTREEAIEILQGAIKKPNTKDGYLGQAIDVAIKALEQEPTDKNFTKADLDAIVKAINEGWELRVNEILSKIRAEIEHVKDNPLFGMVSNDTMLEVVLEIIDKHNTDKEQNE